MIMEWGNDVGYTGTDWIIIAWYGILHVYGFTHDCALALTTCVTECEELQRTPDLNCLLRPAASTTVHILRRKPTKPV